MNNKMLDFVKAKLEENEGVSSDALARILAASQRQSPAAARQSSSAFNSFSLPRPSTNHRPPTTRLSPLLPLLAASLAVAACGWFLHTGSVRARHENNLANVIELLSAADGVELAAASSTPDNLLAWQDAPSDASESD